MAFTAIDSTEVLSGKPVTTTVMGKIKDNFDDHESRIAVIESGASVTYPPMILRVNGNYSVRGAITGVLKTTANFPIRITGVRVLIDTAGSAGTTEIDIKYSRSGAAYQSIFTTKPSVAYTAGNDAISSNGVVNTSYDDLLAGDIIRLDLTSVQTDGVGFTVRVDYVGA